MHNFKILLKSNINTKQNVFINPVVSELPQATEVAT